MKRDKFIKYITVTLMALATLAIFSSCAHKHHFGKFTVLEAPSCTKTGLEEAVCECGVITEVEIPMTDHVPGPWEITTPATCVSNGLRQQHCKDCKILLDSQTIPTLGHDMVKREAKAPTCAEEGYSEHEICTRCDYSTKVNLAPLPHTPGAEADCTNPQVCTVCNTVLDEAKGHRQNIIPGIPATCTKTGLSDIVECLNCHRIVQEQIIIPERAHTVVDIPETPATCSKKGLSAGKKCAVCGFEYIRQVVLPKTSHTFTNDDDATCDVCGKVRVTGCDHPDETLDVTDSVVAICRTYGISSSVRCKKCNEILREAEVTPAKNHSVEVVSGYPATATKPGLTDGRRCSICLTILVAQEIIPAGDTRSPEISISDEELLGGDTPEATILDYNEKITNALAKSSFKLTEKTSNTVSYSYGGTTTDSSTDVFTFNNGNWSTSSDTDGVKIDMVFVDGILYVKQSANGQITKNKCPYLTEEELRSLLGLDFTNSGLMAYKKVTFEPDGNNTTFKCSGLDTEVDSVLTDMLKYFESLGTVDIKSDKVTMTMTVDENYRILSQSSDISISVEMPFIGGTQNSTSTVCIYEYGDYKVTVPEDADSYTEKSSFAEMFR